MIESGHGHSGNAANIKLHHNVGGLPQELGFELIEPLRSLFKDEVRKLGEVLGLPEQMVWRHPFPGPGLAVRILGPVTKEGLDLLREADEILLEEIVANNSLDASTTRRSASKWSRNIDSTICFSFFRSRPLSTKMQVNCFPMALANNAATTEESTPPDRPPVYRCWTA